jgi:hypothetical protein
VERRRVRITWLMVAVAIVALDLIGGFLSRRFKISSTSHWPRLSGIRLVIPYGDDLGNNCPDETEKDHVGIPQGSEAEPDEEHHAHQLGEGQA